MESPATTPVAASPSAPAAVGSGNSTALDQWRGLALVFVLISHGFYFTRHVDGLGRVGVNLFFFISGVLVFRSLAKPVADSRALALGFWRRRLRRLYPALAAYLVAMAAGTYLLQNRPGLIPHSDLTSYVRSAPFALLYTINYWPPHAPMSQGHLWSLSCEMQFYLLAPLIFLLGGQTVTRRFWVWGFILGLLVVSGLIGPFLDHNGDYKYHFELAVWPMMAGFVCEYRKQWFRRIPAQLARVIINLSWPVLAAGVALTFLSGSPKKVVVALGALALLPCFLAYLNGQTVPGPIGRALAWLGERTYSIYLWQQPFTICGYLPSLWHPVGALVSVLVGGLWFRWFERPFLSGGRKHTVGD